ncbi:MAG: DAK2 domain-containing protein, partial [Anaerolineae bacterium]
MATSDSPTARTTTVAAPRTTEGTIPAIAAPAGVDGAGFHDLLRAGLDWLDAHHGIVNALNVFPVPDGDTGTNMLLTMKSALQEITNAAATTLGQVARAAAHGALMGARGNSGVILS